VTAIAAVTLDEASGGRAVLGLGAGGSGFAQLACGMASAASWIVPLGTGERPSGQLAA